MKFTTLSAYLIACSLSLAFTSTTFAKEKDEDSEESDGEVTIEKTVLARNVEAEHKFEPVKSFTPDDEFAVLVFLSEAKAGTKAKAVWTIVDAGGHEDEKILEKKVELTAEGIKGVEEANRINFTLSHDKPFPTGDYKVDIYLNGELAKTIEFKIKE